VQAFEREIAAWPADQAAAPLRIVRAVISGEWVKETLDPETGELGSTRSPWALGCPVAEDVAGDAHRRRDLGRREWWGVRRSTVRSVVS
jgi:hypothetical protein